MSPIGTYNSHFSDAHSTDTHRYRHVEISFVIQCVHVDIHLQSRDSTEQTIVHSLQAFEMVTHLFMQSWNAYHSLPNYLRTACVTLHPFPSPSADCSVPLPPPFGNINPFTSTVEGASIIYQCNDSFLPDDPVVSVCGDDGLWDPDPETHNCTGK